MAQKVSVTLVDDVDGSKADESVSFALDGVTYEIDLSGTNAEKLRTSLAEFVSSARRVGKTSRRGRRAAGRALGTGPAHVDRAQNQAMREWARANGHDISDRGRIPVEIQRSYHAAHAPTPAPEPAAEEPTPKRRTKGTKAVPTVTFQPA